MSRGTDTLREAQACLEAGRCDDAESLCRRAIDASSNDPEAWVLLGAALERGGSPERARDAYARALEIDARHVGAHIRLGSAVFAADVHAGLAHFERAHALDPRHPGARRCLALAWVAVAGQHAERREWAETFACYDRALAADPEHAGAHWNLAWELLKQGRLREGWTHFEWRWRWEGFSDRPRGFPQPQWRGEPLDGRTILIHAEQGLGDAIQFCRYVPLVAARGGRVVFEVPRRLIRLMACLPGIAGLVARGDRLPPFDCHSPLLSLPGVFETTIDSIPGPSPYLTAPEGERRPLAPQGVRTVGLVWAGSPGHALDARRSIPLHLFLPLMSRPGLRWFSLQRGPGAAALRTVPPGLRFADLEATGADFADTASQVARLDLVISVDTSVAHLAGAMGKPVWILVPASSDWRWFLDRDDSPWYPTARLFRQQVSLDWAPVVEAVAGALDALAPR